MGGFLGDLGDGLNAGLKVGGDLIDSGKKKLGEVVDYGSDKLGDGLDYVGLDKAGDVVHNVGDHLAAGLGATPTEQGLGHTDDPTQLVHGNPGKIRESAKHLKDFHKAFDRVGDGLRKVDASGWKGEAKDAFHRKIAIHPTKWAQAAEACGTAAEALDSYADTIKWAQDKAQDAIDTYKRGQRASETSAKAYNSKVDAYNAKIEAGEDPGTRPDPWKDPGEADRAKAEHILEDARRARNEAATKADAALSKALAHAPAEPPPLTQLGNNLGDLSDAVDTELTHVVGGVVKGGAGLINFARGLNPTDPYNLTHPAAYYQNVTLTLAGLASTAAHPERIVTSAIDGFKNDPSEFAGRLIPEALGTKGAGFAKSGVRLGLRTGEKAAVREGKAAVREGKTAAREMISDGPQERVEPPKQKFEKDKTDPIDLVTGKMYLPQTDIVLPGNLPLIFTRRVESGSRLGRWFGPSWTSTLDQRLEVDTEGVIFVTEDGLLLTYPHPAPGVPTLPAYGSRRWPLDRVDGGYTVTDPRAGHTWHFADQGENLAVLAQIDDRNGNWLTFEYDAEGAPLGISSSGGYHLRVISNHHGRIAALRLAGAAPDGTDQDIKRYGYSADGNLTEVINSSGLPLRFTYDERGRVTSWTDANDRSYTYEYDDQDRCIAEGGAAGHMTLRLSYDDIDANTGHRVTTTTNTAGHSQRYLINDAGQVVTEIDPMGTATHFRRDHHNRLLSRTDALGHTTTYRYDDAGCLISVVRSDGRETRISYDENKRPVKVTGADGTTRHQTYDGNGNRTMTTGSDGRSTRFVYDEAGRLMSVTDPLGNVTVVRCNRAGLPVAVTDPLGATTTYTRDGFGRVTCITNPLGRSTSLRWTVEGLLAQRTAPDGAIETWRYDGEGNCTEYVDRVGGRTCFEYTHFDLLVAQTGPDGARHEFTHDAELRLTRVTNPQGKNWSYAYDPADRLIRETDFDGRTMSYAHDGAGRLRSRTDALGQTVSFERDSLGRVVRKDDNGVTTTFSYDFTGQLAEASSPDSTVTMLRDRRGRLLSETVDGRTLSYSYDGAGRRTGRTTPSGATSEWTYDAAGNPTRLLASDRVIDFTYDPAGRELDRRFGASVTMSNSYDACGRLATQSVVGREQRSPLQQRTYTYRPDGNVTAVDDLLEGARHFELDAAGRVTAVRATDWAESYAYDAAGNQTSAHWPMGHPGHEATGTRTYEGTRITRAGYVRYQHDALGRITLRQKTRLSRKPETWRYVWDAEDRLTEVTTPDGTRWRYTYDPLGRRTQKLRIADDGSHVAERVVFTWDGVTLCEQTATGPGLPAPVTLTWDHKDLRPVAQTERIGSAPDAQDEIDSRFFAIVTDLIGTPRELVDEQGRIGLRTRTTLWGTLTWNSDATTYTPLRFPGQYFDPETGLHYNYFRHYDPETARYLSLDPLGLTPAPNPATYVSNPLTWADPLGLAPNVCPDMPPVGRDLATAKADALRDAGIPEGAVPLEVNPYTPATTPEYAGSKQLLDENHQPIYYTEEVYEHPNGRDFIVFQDHWMGHQKPGEPGYQRPHVHVRPFEDTRNGQVPGCEEHYPYDPE